MDKTVFPVALQGEVTVPPSKSMAHRAVLAAALAKGESRIENIALSEDIRATIAAVRGMGAKATLDNTTLKIEGICNQTSMPEIDCGESGTTLRFMIPVLAALGGGTVTGRGRLPQRPVGAYLDIFNTQGILYERAENGLPLTVRGFLKPDRFKISGAVSSQYISGLMFALPLLSGNSVIMIEDKLESAAYVDMTVQTMRKFGININARETHRHYTVEGGQSYKPAEFTVEGDWSQAAFFLLAGVSGGDLKIRGLLAGTFQPDREFQNILWRMGAKITETPEGLHVVKSGLKATNADVSQCPDIAPALAGAMAIAKGKSIITGGKRLKIKESDRIQATAHALNAIGAKIEPTEDGMMIYGMQKLKGGRACAANDHRIAMTLAALSPFCEEPVVIEGAEAVNKSYPNFFEDFICVGGKVL